jgi:hypothetical protein
MSAAASAMTQQDDQHRKRVVGKPFEKGVSQSALFAATRDQMEREFIADLEEAGREVSKADRLLVSRYIQFIRSRKNSDLNTAMKIREALIEKYARNQPGMTLAKYADMLAKKDAK